MQRSASSTAVDGTECCIRAVMRCRERGARADKAEPRDMRAHVMQNTRAARTILHNVPVTTVALT